MTTPTNAAAYQTAPKKRPLEVRSAPYPSPAKDEIVIRSAALAINPIDWIQQDQGTSLAFPWLKYPYIPGYDVAGDVVEVGAGVTRFKKGDRVVGLALGQNKERNRLEETAFQAYVLLSSHFAAPIPNEMSYESASVMPLGMATAAAALFQKDQLGLTLPSSHATPTGKTVIIWGGSTSVGCNAIQLAKAAGYEVVTTASPRNFDLCKNLGASEVFDYKSKTVVADVAKALQGKTCAGALSIGSGGADACFDVLHRCKGHKFISMATYPLPDPLPKRFVLPITMYTFISWMVAAFFKSKLRGIKWNFINAASVAESGIGKSILEDYLGKALADGSFKPSPEPMVVGKGLESMQEALDIQKKGMSAKKVVVTM